MSATYEGHLTSLGGQFVWDLGPGGPKGSTDMGNVSYVVPGIHPAFYIGTDAHNHTRPFSDASGQFNGLIVEDI